MDKIFALIKSLSPRSFLPMLRTMRGWLYRFSDRFHRTLTSRSYLGARLFYLRGEGLVERIRFGAPLPYYEKPVCDAIENALNSIEGRRKPIFFDIGANIGLVSLAVVQHTDADVHAFEPGVKQFAALQATIAANDLFSRMRAYPVALSHVNGIIEFHSSTTEGAGSGDGIRATSRVGETYTYEVETETLDSWCTRHKLYPDIIKIDTEGAEKYILEGATDVLKRKPVLFIEISPLNLSAYPYTAEDIIDMLHTYGYVVTSMSGTLATKSNIRILADVDDMFVARAAS